MVVMPQLGGPRERMVITREQARTGPKRAVEGSEFWPGLLVLVGTKYPAGTVLVKYMYMYMYM